MGLLGLSALRGICGWDLRFRGMRDSCTCLPSALNSAPRNPKPQILSPRHSFRSFAAQMLVQQRSELSVRGLRTFFTTLCAWRAGDLVSKVTSRVIIGVTPFRKFRVLITLLITYLLSPLPLQVDPKP